ncbi:hypothetical protein F4821DRAFT_278420 [Hypoxylon rubiginosum]|uniref:Uncharacterized protein n=1 Tax=Hypoxylon rubiginosum TaxID=110542 RepID=A0ACC0D2C6_9PEZI|nr:hypothetical protein F4821DRAFT_278420 [Hypoxylon rubiginosum]
MVGCSPSPNLARILFFTTIFIFGLLIAVSVWNCILYYTPDDSSTSAETSTLVEQPLPQDGGSQSQYAERGLRPTPFSNLVPAAATPMKLDVTVNWNSTRPGIDSSSTEQSETLSWSKNQPTSPVTVQPAPTSSEIHVLSEKLESFLGGVVPLAASSIVDEATSQAQVLAASAQAIATDIASLADEVKASKLQAPDALKSAEDLLESLDAAVGTIAKDIIPTSGLPAPVVDELFQAVSSGLGNIVNAPNGPVSLVGDLIKDNICTITIIVDDIPSTVAGLCGDTTSAVAGGASASTTDSPMSNVPASSTTEASLSLAAATLTSGATVLTSPTIAASISLSFSLSITSPESALQTPVPTPQNSIGSSGGETGSQVSASNEVTSPAGMSGNTLSNIQSSSTPSVIPASIEPGFNSNSESGAGTSDSAGSKSAAGEPNTTAAPSSSFTASAHSGREKSSIVTTTGTDEIVTVRESITVTEDCALPPIRTIFLVGPHSTHTVYEYNQCPTPPPCPDCASPTCHCPEAGGVPPATTLPGGSSAQGPCPGAGYTCDDCLDGWFCPPPQTPAQSAPCGFGWPCVHCDGGWFCVPRPTLGPDTCSESSGPTANGAGTITSTSTSTVTFTAQPTGPSPNQPHPRIPNSASG